MHGTVVSQTPAARAREAVQARPIAEFVAISGSASTPRSGDQSFRLAR